MMVRMPRISNPATVPAPPQRDRVECLEQIVAARCDNDGAGQLLQTGRLVVAAEYGQDKGIDIGKADAKGKQVQASLPEMGDDLLGNDHHDHEQKGKQERDTQLKGIGPSKVRRGLRGRGCRPVDQDRTADGKSAEQQQGNDGIGYEADVHDGDQRQQPQIHDARGSKNTGIQCGIRFFQQTALSRQDHGGGRAGIQSTQQPGYQVTLAFQQVFFQNIACIGYCGCLLYTSPSPRDSTSSRMPSSA